MSRIAIALLLVPALARADAPPEATALFDQGIKDLQAGNLDAACKELASSLARYSDSGTKGALATCYTRQGRIVSAWNLWRDLADTAPADLRADAAANAAQLEPRLPHFVLQAPAVPGLVVTINGTVADPALGVPLPVDPGPVFASARAPAREPWSQTYQATEGKTLTIEVPPLAEVHAPAPVVTPVKPAVEPSTARHDRHVLAFAIGAAGLGVAIGGIITGGVASSNWNAAKTSCGSGGIGSCQLTGLADARDDVSSARTWALISTIGIAAGGAALLGGAILYFTAPADETALHVTPALGPSSYGVALSGGW